MVLTTDFVYAFFPTFIPMSRVGTARSAGQHQNPIFAVVLEHRLADINTRRYSYLTITVSKKLCTGRTSFRGFFANFSG